MGSSLNAGRVESNSDFYSIILVSPRVDESRETGLTGPKVLMIKDTSGGIAICATEFTKKCGTGIGSLRRTCLT